MKMNSKKILLRIATGLGYALAVIVGYLAFNSFLLQIAPYIGERIMNHPLVNAFIIGLAIFAFASGFLRETIFKYFAEGGRIFFMMGMAIYAIDGRSLGLTIQNIYVEADVSIILTLFLFAMIIDLARVILSALNYLAEKEEAWHPS